MLSTEAQKNATVKGHYRIAIKLYRANGFRRIEFFGFFGFVLSPAHKSPWVANVNDLDPAEHDIA